MIFHLYSRLLIQKYDPEVLMLELQGSASVATTTGPDLRLSSCSNGVEISRVRLRSTPAGSVRPDKCVMGPSVPQVLT